MDSAKFLQCSKDKLINSYNLEDNKEVSGFRTDLYAYYNERVSKYVLSKKNEYFVFQNTEILLFKIFEEGVSLDDIDNFKQYLLDNASEIADINDEHMSTTIKLVAYSHHPIDKEVKKKAKRFRFYKSFNKGYQGWINGAVVLVEAQSQSTVASRFGKREAKHLFDKKFFAM